MVVSMHKSSVIFTVLITLSHHPGYSAEIDSVTTRNVKLENSRVPINEIINHRIEEGTRNANEQLQFVADLEEFEEEDNDDYCSEETLYTEIRKSLYQSLTASWGLKGYDLDRQLRKLLVRHSYSLSLNDSIYRDIDYLEGFSLKLKELSDVVNIDGHLVGLDKIGHFFAEGWRYFELTHSDDLDFQQALDWGRKQEVGKFGYSATGIFSFADLVANLNGWRFWNRILLDQDDPLKGTIGNFFSSPYVSCEIQIMDSIKNRKIVKAWEYNARFDISDYIDGAWDEGNNCNSYADPFIEAKVRSRIKETDPEFSCPFKPEYCADARKKYGYFAKFVLHPYCLTVPGD